MILHSLILSALLVASTTAIIDCSVKDTCFGEPANCDPNTSCESLLHFDADGNMHLFLRHFTDKVGYAAFAVDRQPADTIDYFICLPYQGQRLRAVAKLGGKAVITEQERLGVVQRISSDYFRCLFNDVSDLRMKFKNQQIVVSKGTFQEGLDIMDGVKVYSVTNQEEMEEEEVIPVVHQIRARVEPLEDVFSSDDSDLVVDAIKSLPKADDDDDDLERFVRKESKRRLVEEEEEEEPRRRSQEDKGKKTSRSRPTRYEDDQDEDFEEERSKPSRRQEEEDSEERIPKRKGGKRSRDEEDEDEEEIREKKGRKKTKKVSKMEEDDEEWEEDEDEDDDEENSSRSLASAYSILTIAILKLFF